LRICPRAGGGCGFWAGLRADCSSGLRSAGPLRLRGARKCAGRLPSGAIRAAAGRVRTGFGFGKGLPKKPEQTRFSPPDAEKRRRPRGLRRAGIMAARHRRAAPGCAAGAPALAAFASPAGNHRPTISRWPRGAPSGFRDSDVPAESLQTETRKKPTRSSQVFHRGRLPDFVRQSAAKRQGISAA